jgi:hypothetical protein
MEDIRSYRTRNEDDDWTIPDDERDWSGPEDEVPFHIPRD